MLEYWWLALIAAGVLFAAGAVMWFYGAAAMVRVMAPSAEWLARESRFNRLAAGLMTIGAICAVIGIAMAVGYWARP
jgi:hypothetical protein